MSTVEHHVARLQATEPGSAAKPRRRRGTPAPICTRAEQVDFEVCQETLGYRFDDQDLLQRAVTHSSGAETRVECNERLEFLGDAILGMVVCHALYERYPERQEGELTKIKSVVVSRRTCGRLARELGLDRFLILGRGMITGQAIPINVLAAVFEALVGAIYLDGGLDAAREFVLRVTLDDINRSAESEDAGNYKSLLQQATQRQSKQPPTYQMLAEAGPDHCKAFQVAAVVDGVRFPAAWGRNKKDAEQRAALNALCRLEDRPVAYPSELLPVGRGGNSWQVTENSDDAEVLQFGLVDADGDCSDRTDTT